MTFMLCELCKRPTLVTPCSASPTLWGHYCRPCNHYTAPAEPPPSMTTNGAPSGGSAPTDKVREAAGALCDYLDKTSGGEEWKGASLVRQLRAALAAPLAAPSDDATEGARLAYALQRPDSPQARILTILGIYRDKMPVAAVEALQIMADQLALAAPSGGDATPRDEAVEPVAWAVVRANGTRFYVYQQEASAAASVARLNAETDEGFIVANQPYRVVALVPREES